MSTISIRELDPKDRNKARFCERFLTLIKKEGEPSFSYWYLRL